MQRQESWGYGNAHHDFSLIKKNQANVVEKIAMRLLAMGYHVGILRYSVAPARFPTALLELAEVMKLIHKNN